MTRPRRRYAVRAHARRTGGGRTRVSAHTRNRAFGAARVRTYHIREGAIEVPANRVVARVDAGDGPSHYYPLFEMNGTPITNTFQAVGFMNDDMTVFTAGDPYKTATLHEYRVADQPTRASQDEVDGFVRGFDAKRALPEAFVRRQSSEWHQGYYEARRVRERA